MASKWISWIGWAADLSASSSSALASAVFEMSDLVLLMNTSISFWRSLKSLPGGFWALNARRKSCWRAPRTRSVSSWR